MKNKIILLILVLSVNIILLYAHNQPATNHYIIYPAPLGESLSQYYKVSVEGENVPVYRVKVAPILALK